MPWCLDTMPKKAVVLEDKAPLRLIGRILKVEVFNELLSAFSVFPA